MPLTLTRSTTNSPLKVVFVIDGTAGCGAERSLLSLVRALDRSQFRPVLFNVGAEGPLTDAFRQSVDCFYSFPKKRRFDTVLVRRLIKVVKTENADLIVSVLFYADIIAGLAAHCVSVPVLTWQHAIPSADTKNNRWYHHLAHRFARRCISATVCCGESVRSDVMEVYHPTYPLYIVHNGVDPNRFSRINRSGSGEFTIGTVSRLSPQKGVQYVLLAFSVIAERIPEACLKIAGDGTEMKKLQEMALSLGIEDRVEFFGFIDRVEAFLSRLDCFVLASENEACPVCILEAMAASCTVVASDLPGIRELIDSTSGILFPVGDIEALAQHFIQLAEDSGHGKRLAATARGRVVACFNTQRQHEQLCTVMKSTVRRFA